LLLRILQAQGCEDTEAQRNIQAILTCFEPLGSRRLAVFFNDK
jgi:hypothetical protein